MSEKPDTVHGRLMEAIHIAGYSMERAFTELKWLGIDGKWKQCGAGFEEVNDFLSTLQLGQFKWLVDQRKEIAKLYAGEGASQRAIAGALGVSAMQVNRDLNPVTNVTKQTESLHKSEDFVTSVTAPSVIGKGGAEAAKIIQRKANKDDRKEQQRESRISADEEIHAAGYIKPDFRIGDFREVLSDIPDGSVDLILTDPPYGEKAIKLYEDLGTFASRVLKPDGSLIAYSGQSVLGDVLLALSRSLRYWWTLCMKHSGTGQKLPGKWVFVDWKPIVWFVKERRRSNNFVKDFLLGEIPDKTSNPWAQGAGETEYLVQELTAIGDLVVDPFAGTGEWGKGVGRLGRRWIGSDLQPGGGMNI